MYTDRCCRDHDYCAYRKGYLPAKKKSQSYNLTNPYFYDV